MKNQLTIQDIRHFPIGLEFRSPTRYKDLKWAFRGFSVNSSGHEHITLQGASGYCLRKDQLPLLRSLTQLTKEITHDGETFVPEEELNGNIDNGALDWVLDEVSKGKQIERLLDLSYHNIEQLLKWRFNVFGLDPSLFIELTD